MLPIFPFDDRSNSVFRFNFISNCLTRHYLKTLFISLILISTLLISACSENNHAEENQPSNNSSAAFLFPTALQAAAVPTTCANSMQASIKIDDDPPVPMTIQAQDGTASYRITEWPLGLHTFLIEFKCQSPQLILLASATITQNIIDGPNVISFTSNDYFLPDLDGDNVSNINELVLGTDPFNAPDITPPTAPTLLRASNITINSVELNWNPANDDESGVTNYKIYRDNIFVTEANAPPYVDSTLTPSTSYRYYVTAVNAAAIPMEGPNSNEILVSTETPTDVTPPSAPGEPQAGSITAQSIELNWSPATDAQSGIASYNVYRADLPNPILVITPPYVDTNLAENTEYSYQVSANNGEMLEGPLSPIVTISTLADTTPPTAPGEPVAANITTQSIVLSWDAATDSESGIIDYNVYRDGSVVSQNNTTSPFVDTGLTASTGYSYQLSAINGASIEGPLTTAIIFTTQTGIDTTPPNAPGTPAAGNITARSIELIWAPATDSESGIIDYKVYRDGNLISPLLTTSPFVDTGLTASTPYSYEVSAINGALMEGPVSAAIIITTRPDTDTTPPTQPGSPVAGNITTQSIEVTWSPATDPESGIDSYNVYRDGKLRTSTTSPLYLDTGLADATAYNYYVKAVNGVLLEGPQSTVTLITTATDNTPPTMQTVTTAALSTEVTVVFSEPIEAIGAATIANYQITPAITVSAATLSTDMTTVTLTTSPLSVDTLYTLNVSNITDLATTANTIVPVSTQTFTYLISATSRANYQWDLLTATSLVYSDQIFAYETIPIELLGVNYLRTVNADINIATKPFLNFTVSYPVIVYVGYDVNSPAPAWLSPAAGWQQSALTIDFEIANAAQVFQLYTKSFPTGQVLLDNQGDALLMYTVYLKPDLTAVVAPLSSNSVSAKSVRQSDSSTLVIIGVP